MFKHKIDQFFSEVQTHTPGKSRWFSVFISVNKPISGLWAYFALSSESIKLTKKKGVLCKGKLGIDKENWYWQRKMGK